MDTFLCDPCLVFFDFLIIVLVLGLRTPPLRNKLIQFTDKYLHEEMDKNKHPNLGCFI